MPRQTVIENPILNSPFAMPTRHFRFDDEGITNETVAERRASSYFVPIAKPKKNVAQLDWVGDRIEENEHVNDFRRRVDQWRRRPACESRPGWPCHDLPDRRSQRRPAQSQSRQSRHRQKPLAPCRQQPRRTREVRLR